MTEAERVATIADVMLAKGIRYLRMGDIEVQIGPSAADPSGQKPSGLSSVPVPVEASVTPPPDPGQSFMLPADGLCRCGHPMVDHAEHGCLVGGCPIETCNGLKVKV